MRFFMIEAETKRIKRFFNFRMYLLIPTEAGDEM